MCADCLYLYINNVVVCVFSCWRKFKKSSKCVVVGRLGGGVVFGRYIWVERCCVVVVLAELILSCCGGGGE